MISIYTIDFITEMSIDINTKMSIDMDNYTIELH